MNLRWRTYTLQLNEPTHFFQCVQEILCNFLLLHYNVLSQILVLVRLTKVQQTKHDKKRENVNFKHDLILRGVNKRSYLTELNDTLTILFLDLFIYFNIKSIQIFGKGVLQFIWLEFYFQVLQSGETLQRRKFIFSENFFSYNTHTTNTITSQLYYQKLRNCNQSIPLIVLNKL